MQHLELPVVVAIHTSQLAGKVTLGLTWRSSGGLSLLPCGNPRGGGRFRELLYTQGVRARRKVLEGHAVGSGPGGPVGDEEGDEQRQRQEKNYEGVTEGTSVAGDSVAVAPDDPSAHDSFAHAAAGPSQHLCADEQDDESGGHEESPERIALVIRGGAAEGVGKQEKADCSGHDVRREGREPVVDERSQKTSGDGQRVGCR